MIEADCMGECAKDGECLGEVYRYAMFSSANDNGEFIGNVDLCCFGAAIIRKRGFSLKSFDSEIYHGGDHD